MKKNLNAKLLLCAIFSGGIIKITNYNNFIKKLKIKKKYILKSKNRSLIKHFYFTLDKCIFLNIYSSIFIIIEYYILTFLFL